MKNDPQLKKMMIMVDPFINKIYLIIFFWNKIIYKSHCKDAGDFLANEKIGKIYYSSVPRAKQSADCVTEQHSTKVELVEDPLVIDISLGVMKVKLTKKLSVMKKEEIICSI